MSLLGLIRAAEEELRAAQMHAGRVRAQWPPSSQLDESELLVARTLDLIAAAQKRRDGSGATHEELRRGWQALARLELARTRAQERWRSGAQ